MKALYVESSAVLRWLLAEPAAEVVMKQIEAHKHVVSSALTIVETERALLRFEHQGSIKPAQRAKLAAVFRRAANAWSLREITTGIRERAGKPFPVEPVRSRDALHLATVLEFLDVYDELAVLSYDQRILANLAALGLSVA
jgi:predicted nucleic acid-binding protein